jgi:hypothetical protein
MLASFRATSKGRKSYDSKGKWESHLLSCSLQHKFHFKKKDDGADAARLLLRATVCNSEQRLNSHSLTTNINIHTSHNTNPPQYANTTEHIYKKPSYLSAHHPRTILRGWFANKQKCISSPHYISNKIKRRRKQHFSKAHFSRHWYRFHVLASAAQRKAEAYFGRCTSGVEISSRGEVRELSRP